MHSVNYDSFLISGLFGPCLHGGGGPQVGEVARLGGVTCLMRDCMDRRVAPTCGPPPPC